MKCEWMSLKRKTMESFNNLIKRWQHDMSGNRKFSFCVQHRCYSFHWFDGDRDECERKKNSICNLEKYRKGKNSYIILSTSQPWTSTNGWTNGGPIAWLFVVKICLVIALAGLGHGPWKKPRSVFASAMGSSSTCFFFSLSRFVTWFCSQWIQDCWKWFAGI